jgi:hypothetical protein
LIRAAMLSGTVKTASTAAAKVRAAKNARSR